MPNVYTEYDAVCGMVVQSVVDNAIDAHFLGKTHSKRMKEKAGAQPLVGIFMQLQLAHGAHDDTGYSLFAVSLHQAVETIYQVLGTLHRAIGTLHPTVKAHHQASRTAPQAGSYWPKTGRYQSTVVHYPPTTGAVPFVINQPAYPIATLFLGWCKRALKGVSLVSLAYGRMRHKKRLFFLREAASGSMHVLHISCMLFL